jgi:hypothetical protein
MSPFALTRIDMSNAGGALFILDPFRFQLGIELASLRRVFVIDLSDIDLSDILEGYEV